MEWEQEKLCRKIDEFPKVPKKQANKKESCISILGERYWGGGRKSCMRGRKLGRCQMSQQFAIHKIMEQCSCSDMKK